MQPHEVAQWRRRERERLLAVRAAMPAGERAAQTAALIRALDASVPRGAATVVSVYWPIRGEPDLRPWMHELSASGVAVALPVATAPAMPLAFRRWRPGAPMARGLWNIPYPADVTEVLPTVMIAPAVGFDRSGYRLGYGGGFFDRTLAVLTPRPLVIGVGFPAMAIATIHPQAHDIAMDRIVTGGDAAID